MVGGKRVTRMATYTEDKPRISTTLFNRKRTELSIATASNPNKTLQRQIPEHRTKRKGEEEIRYENDNFETPQAPPGVPLYQRPLLIGAARRVHLENNSL